MTARDDTYIEVLDTRSGDARKTNIGAMFPTADETIFAFNSLRHLHKENAPMLFDLYVGGDLSDTLALEVSDTEMITNETLKHPDYYVALEQEATRMFLESRKAEKAGEA